MDFGKCVKKTQEVKPLRTWSRTRKGQSDKKVEKKRKGARRKRKQKPLGWVRKNSQKKKNQSTRARAKGKAPSPRRKSPLKSASK